MRFSIAILGREQNPHVACFEEVARGLAEALRRLGHEVVDFSKPGRLIIFGAGNDVPVGDAVPNNSIIYNAEQMTAGGVSNQMVSFDHWKSKMVIWDYSEFNVQKLREAGAARVVHCPIGYIDTMKTIQQVDVEDIPVLHYGSISQRRREILEDLNNAGIEVKTLFKVYGKERDDIIARSKIVLNLHFYESSVFEIFRCSHLLANGKCVVSEDGGKDVLLETFAQKATVYTPRKLMADTVRNLLASSWARKSAAVRGHEEFKKLDFVEHVRRALEQS